ncbi:MAG: ATP-binding protein [Pirellulaceae bacterium]|nr:26S protease regulatory subunit [Planctomycetales bacterium]
MALLATILKKYLGDGCTDFPVFGEEFDSLVRPSLQVAIDGMLQTFKASTLGGVVERGQRATLARMVDHENATDFPVGPVEFVDCDLGCGERLACVRRGLYLLESECGDRSVVLLNTTDSCPTKIRLEIMAGKRQVAESLLRHLANVARTGEAYRGRVFSLELGSDRTLRAKFHSLPQINPDSIILPERLLERIERHTIDFSRRAARLRQSGCRLKRGLLLHGSSGTGKTLTTRYLVSSMENRTVIMLQGDSAELIESACRLASTLEPSTVILEDINRIGTGRQGPAAGASEVVFELVSQMDKVSDDLDVLFVLTTNRIDGLESPLASCPGRIEEAFELPLPDEDCRKRLLTLYGRGFNLDPQVAESFAIRLESASAAFISELLRKAALLAAEDDSQVITIRQHHLEDALTELLVVGGRLH